MLVIIIISLLGVYFWLKWIKKYSEESTDENKTTNILLMTLIALLIGRNDRW